MATIDSKNLIVWLKSMYRGQPLPLDFTEIHESFEEAQKYAKSPTAYEGQTIKVKLDDGKYHEYIVQPSYSGNVLEKVNVTTVCATIGSELPNLAIKNGQIIFVKDKRTIALDFDGERIFYNQIEVLNTDEERISLISPVSSTFYFIIDTAILWFYQDKWIPITTQPKEVVFIGTELPELGKNKIIYIDKVKKNISIWDEETSSYIIVGEKINEISADEIDALFQIKI